MRKTILSVMALALLALVDTAQAAPYAVRLIAHNQRSSSGTLSTLKWSGCTTYTGSGATATACINPANVTLANMGITPSTAVWTWDPATGILSSTGTFNSASTISSSGAAGASAVIGDRVTDMVINTGTSTTTAATYLCAEGNFLAGVGANGCLNISLGDDFALNSSAVYNVGGDANCVKRTIGGDDVSTGNTRTLANTAGNGTTCDPGDGAFNLWTVTDNTGTGGTLVLSNGIPLANAGTNYLTFARAPDATDDTKNVLPQVATNVPVMANDIAYTDPVTVAIGTLPSKGTATVTGSPGNQAAINIQYTSNAGETGTDTFTYTATDANGTDTATVTITILDVGANPDTGTTTRNKPVTINVGANDTGFTAGNVTVTELGSCDQGGDFTPGAPGAVANATIAYTPATTATGAAGYTEVCTYQITDGVLTDSATVTVTVNNTIPVANAGAISVSTAGVAPATASGTVNVASIAGNNLGDTPSTVSATPGAKGTTSVSGNVVTYTPGATFFEGTDSFDYTITDSDPGTAETATGTVTVTIPDVAPTVADTSITTTSGATSAPKALTITAGNGSLAQHVVSVLTQATSGTCAISGSTSVTYAAPAGFTGSDSCVVQVADGDGDTDPATISVTVNAASGGGGGGVTSDLLPGGGGALDAWGLSLLAAGAWLRRKRRAK